MPPASAFKSIELFDRKALQLIISNWDIIPIDPESKKEWEVGHKKFNPLNILNKYLFGSREDKFKTYSTHSCLYDYSSKSINEGRKYVRGALGLQSFARPIRHTLSHKFYDDIDIKNAHPVLALQYCEKKGYNVSHIKNYVDNRDERLQEIMSANNISREDAKSIVLAVLNGGKKGFNDLNNKPEWFVKFKEQVEHIQQLIVNDKENERFVKRARKDRGNVNGSATNHLLCYLEDTCLSACMKFLESKHIPLTNVVLVFDGFMIPKSLCNLNNDFLTEMSNYIHSTCGYMVEFAIKPMNEVIDLSSYSLSENINRDIVVVETDDEAADVFLNQYSDIIKFSNGRIFAFNYNNTWTCDSNTVDTILLDICLKSKIYKLVQNSPKPYSGNISGAKNVIQAVKCRLRDDPDFSKKVFDSSIRKLFFADGYYDFDEKKFINSVKPEDSLTTIRLTYDFPERNNDMIAKLYKNILTTIFSSQSEMGSFLEHIARGIAGQYEDKDWVVGMGERNAGKGIIVLLLEIVFQAYCITLNSESFLLERCSDGDQAKKLSWLLDCEYKRLLLTNELTFDSNSKKKVNGNTIKKIASGGDTLKARKNFTNEVEFKTQGRLFMFLNDLPEIAPSDASETMTVFNFPYQFKENPDPKLPFQKKRDDKLKENIKADTNIRNAFLHIVLDAFKQHRVKPCHKVIDETMKFRAEGGDDWTVIKSTFQVTRNDQDKIFSRDILIWLKGNGLNMSAQKMRHRLEKLGAIYKDNIKIEGKQSNGYVYLKMRNPDDYSEEVESESETEDI